MGVVDDVRKVVQDLVTPDFRALEARLESIDQKLDLTAKTLNEKIDSSSKTLNDKLNQTATKSELAFTRELLVAEMHSMCASCEMTVAKLVMSIDLEKRVSKIESERAQEQVRQLDRTA